MAISSVLFIFKGVRELKVRHENNHPAWWAKIIDSWLFHDSIF